VKTVRFARETACNLVHSVHMSWPYVRKKFSMRAGKLTKEHDVFSAGRKTARIVDGERRETVVFSAF